MNWHICASRVEQGDPDRFAATMIAPVAVRAKLFPLYALNLELAEAAWASPEPLVCLMRLQFFDDALDVIEGGRLVPAHEVLQVLAPLVVGMDLAPLKAMISARRIEVERAHVTSLETLVDWLDASGANVMRMAAALLGGDPADVDGVARAGAIANWLLAVPDLSARGLDPLPGGERAVRRLCELGLAGLNHTDQRAIPTQARPALWSAFQARVILETARHDPVRVREGRLAPTSLGRSLRLVSTRLTGLV